MKSIALILIGIGFVFLWTGEGIQAQIKNEVEPIETRTGLSQTDEATRQSTMLVPVLERSDELKSNIASHQAQLRTGDELEASAEAESGERIDEAVKKKVRTKYHRMNGRLTAAVLRLESIFVRLTTRIAKLEQGGITLEYDEDLITAMDSSIQELKIELEANEVTFNSLVENEQNIQSGVIIIKESNQSTIVSLQQIYSQLKALFESIKASTSS